MSNRNIIRKRIGELPLLKSMADRLKIEEIVSSYLKDQGKEKAPVVDTLMQMVFNLTSSRTPLYKLKEWVLKLDSRLFDEKMFDEHTINDDRFGRALDKLYKVDRASLMTDIVTNTIKIMDISFDQIHNDSTTVKAFGDIPGVTKNGLELKNGKSKDHRPDLKQLVFNLTISADGAVPVHYKTYPGNRTDDTIHIEIWNSIRQISKKKNFLYVADCKVCTDKQLLYITGNGGRVLTVLPETWGEVSTFKDELRKSSRKNKIYISKQKTEETKRKYNVFSYIDGTYETVKHGYSIFWIHSSEKAAQDKYRRMSRINKAEKELKELLPKLNKRKLKSYEQIEHYLNKLIKKYKLERFISLEIIELQEERQCQKGKGRPGKGTHYETVVSVTYDVSWKWDKKALSAEKKVDGLFPLLCTDKKITAKEAFKAYKYQPRLEKRFTQLKSIHAVAPILFKKIERVEAMMFLFFLALILQAVIEREVRKKMKDKQIDSLPLYPENRLAYHPTTAKIIENFEDLSLYLLEDDGKVIEVFEDTLNELQLKILEFLEIPQSQFWLNCKIDK